MNRPSKRKGSIYAWLCACVVLLTFGQTRAETFSTWAQPAPGQIGGANPAFIGENSVACGHALGQVTTSEYDAAGRRTASVDPMGVRTEFQYDALGRLITVISAAGTGDQTVTGYRYDEVGNQIAQIDALGRVTYYKYDDLGRRTRRTLPSGDHEQIDYDEAGNRIRRTDFAGRQTEYFYDEMGRLTALDYVGHGINPDVSHTYYPGTSLRRSTRMGADVTTYVYDSAGRLTQKTPPNNQHPLSYGYDLAGNLEWVKGPNGYQADYEWDALNRLTSATGQPGAVSYLYDAANNVTNRALPNGIATTYSYDELNRVTNLVAAPVGGGTIRAHFGYVRDAAGRRVHDTNYIAHASIVTYDSSYNYDQLGRLTLDLTSVKDFANPGIEFTDEYRFDYDSVGNRTNYVYTPGDSGSPVTQTHAFDANDRLLADAYDANGNTTHSTDAHGNAVEDVYDFENRLIQRRINNQLRFELTYDADGHLVKKQDYGLHQTTVYIVDDRNPTGYSQVLQSRKGFSSGFGAPKIQTYWYGLDLHSQTDSQGSPHFYGYDGHGNVRYLTDATGTVTDSYTYDAYGNLIDRTGASPNNYLYAGEQYDPELGLYYLRARYYNPAAGRFWSMDSWEGNHGNPLTLNKYLYGNANPILYTDPSGHFAIAMSVAGGNLLSGVGRAVKAGIAAEAKRRATLTLIKMSMATALAVTLTGNDTKNRPETIVEFRARLRALIGSDTDGHHIFLHGTSTGAWKGGGDFSKGVGELGAGFYTTKFPSGVIAAGKWAYEREATDFGVPVILVFAVRFSDMAKMRSKEVQPDDSRPYHIYHGYDFVEGPLARLPLFGHGAEKFRPLRAVLSPVSYSFGGLFSAHVPNQAVVQTHPVHTSGFFCIMSGQHVSQAHFPPEGRPGSRILEHR